MGIFDLYENQKLEKLTKNANDNNINMLTQIREVIEMSNYKQIEILKSIDKSLKSLNAKIETLELFIDKNDLNKDELERILYNKSFKREHNLWNIEI